MIYRQYLPIYLICLCAAYQHKLRLNQLQQLLKLLHPILELQTHHLLMKISFDQHILSAKMFQKPLHCLTCAEFLTVHRGEFLVHQLPSALASIGVQPDLQYTYTPHQLCGSMNHVARLKFCAAS